MVSTMNPFLVTTEATPALSRPMVRRRAAGPGIGCCALSLVLPELPNRMFGQRQKGHGSVPPDRDHRHSRPQARPRARNNSSGAMRPSRLRRHPSLRPQTILSRPQGPDPCPGLTPLAYR
jgi:hypothetical protein